MKIRQLIIHILPVLLLFVVFALIRWYNLEERIIFAWDQEQFSNQMKEILANHKPTLLGPRVVSDTGFFLAPYFTYLLVPFYLLTKLHPVALQYFVMTVSAFFFFGTYVMLKKIFDKKTSFFFLLLWTINPLLAQYDSIPWNPIYIPLGVIATWYFFKKIYDTNKSVDWALLGITLGVFVNMHFQFVFLILYSALFVLVSGVRTKKHIFGIVCASAFFLLMFVPLFLFDIRHDFLNIKLLTGFFAHGLDAIPSDRNVWRTVFTIFLEPLLILRNEYVTVLFYIAVAGMFAHLYRNTKKFNRVFNLANLVIWLLFPIGFMVYGKRPSEYYFVFLYPFIYIGIVSFFTSIKRPILLYALIAILVFLNLQPLRNNLKSNMFGLYHKERAVIKLKELTNGKKFNVSFSVPLGEHTGYDYLIDWHGIKQTGNWSVDPLVQVHIPVAKEDIKVGSIGIILPKDF